MNAIVILKVNIINESVDPDEFAKNAERLSEQQISAWWARASFRNVISKSSQRLFDASDAVLKHWGNETDLTSETMTMDGIDGAMRVAVMWITEASDDAFSLTRRFAQHFYSKNSAVAFCAIRQLEVRCPQACSMYTIDHLVCIASGDSKKRTPSPMSVRGLAFKVLFDLDPMFRTWWELQQAYNECVTGCIAWQENIRYKDALERLLRYHRIAK